MDALSLYLPAWPADLARRRWPVEQRDGRHSAVLLTVIDRERTIVGACCARALGAGVLSGMPLAEARAFVRPPLVSCIEPLDAEKNRRALRRLARWAYQLVPIVAVDGDDGLLLDARGCARLYGGIDRLAHRLLAPLKRSGIEPRLAAAPTFGAAWALARFSDAPSPVLVQRDRLDAALASLPIAALRLADEHIEALEAVGVRRIEQLRALPRPSLAARYGPGVLLRLEQALGEAIEILTPIQPKWPLRVEHLFDGPTDHLESITVACRRLVDELAALLIAHHRGSLSLRVELLRPHMDPVWIPVRTSAPCAQARHLWKLLEPKLERAHLGHGVEGVRMMVLRSKRLRDRQAVCWDEEATNRKESGEPGALLQLIDTLHARLGPDQVLRPVAAESHIPERAFGFAPALDGPRRMRVEELEERHGIDRPTLVLGTPIPIEVSLLVPDGPLMTVRIRGEAAAIRSCIGPERLGGEWWRRVDAVRDYFKVQTDDGRWLWIFRTSAGRPSASERWFLHGEWA